MIHFSSEIFSYPAFKLKISTPHLSQDFKIPDIILGKQAEAIFEHLIRNSQDYKLLAANTQVQSQKITIGELDYLIQYIETQEYFHVEVACKFYLFDNTIKSEYEGKWIGPNRKDALLDKLNKLKAKQFPLLFRPELAPTLLDLNLKASQFKQQHYLLTSLYIPHNMNIHTLPQEYQKSVVGTWIFINDLNLKSHFSYAIPTKKQWLLPNDSICNWLNSKEATTQIEESITQKRAVQVYEKKNNLIKKFFVVWW